jgi:hypothetical protein
MAESQTKEQKQPLTLPQPMGKFATISISNVQKVFNLSKGHPVYRVTPRTGAEFVVKADNRGSMGNAAPGIAKFDAKLMTNVSSNTDIEMLTDTEVGQLLMCIGVVKPDEEKHMFRTNVFSPTNFWYKMPLLNLTTIQGMFDKQEGEMLRKVFKEEKNLVKLGKIAAVDTFIGNKDRFDPEGNVANLGNIFFAKKRGLLGTTFTPIGLDFWDGFKDDMNLTLGQSRWDMLQKTQDLATFKEMQSVFMNWLKTLNDVPKMQKFAQNAVESFNGDLERNKVDSIDDSKPKYKLAMARGMEEGAAAIKKYLNNLIAKKGKNGIPVGALYRMQTLGWVK